MTPTPAATSTTCQGANLAVETRNWASAGLRSTRSSVPLRMCSTTLASDGFTAPSSTPFMARNQPMTTSAWSKPQPATRSRVPKTTSSGTTAQAIQKKDMAPCTRKSTRYCIEVCSEARNCTARSRR